MRPAESARCTPPALKPAASRSALVRMPPRRFARRSRSESLESEKRSPMSEKKQPKPVPAAYDFQPCGQAPARILRRNPVTLVNRRRPGPPATYPSTLRADLPPQRAQTCATYRLNTPDSTPPLRSVQAGSPVFPAGRGGKWTSHSALPGGRGESGQPAGCSGGLRREVTNPQRVAGRVEGGRRTHLQRVARRVEAGRPVDQTGNRFPAIYEQRLEWSRVAHQRIRCVGAISLACNTVHRVRPH
jgi:hypothetical protein